MKTKETRVFLICPECREKPVVINANPEELKKYPYVFFLCEDCFNKAMDKLTKNW